MEIYSIQKILITVFAIIFISSGILFGSELDKKVIAELTVRYQQEYQAQVADKEINDLAQNILKDCGITRPVIILQNKKLSNCSVVAMPSKHPQEFMILGTADKGNVKRQKSIDLITASIYHETGHIANDDATRKAEISRNILAGGMYLIGLCGGCAVAYKSFQSSGNIGLAVLIGFGAIVGTVATESLTCMYQSRHKEMRADKFMYEHMIQHGKIAAVITEIHSRMSQQEDELPEFLNTHPSERIRASLGIHCLQKNGIKIKDLIQNLPAELDEELKKDFCKQIEGPCSVLLKKEK